MYATVPWCQIESQQSPFCVVNSHFLRYPDKYWECCHNLVLLNHLSHIWEPSYEVLYEPEASKIWQVKLLWSQVKSFNFDQLYFWSPFRYRVILYLIRKLLDMVNMIQEGKVVAALSTSIRTSWKVGIYYINWALLILKWKPLYCTLW